MININKSINEEIRSKLFNLSEDEYRNFHNKLCPNTENILGVRLPLLRNMAKDLAKNNWEAYLNNPYNEYYEEIMIEGLTIGYIKADINTRFKYIKRFIPKIDNWAIGDSFCNNLKFTKKNLNEVWEFISTYLSSNKEFELRFAIVMMLHYYINEEYIDRVLHILNDINHEGYYVKMAVAWAISYCYISFPEKTLDFLKNNNLDKFTYNKSLQKIIESNRVDKDIKNLIRSMKIK